MLAVVIALAQVLACPTAAQIQGAEIVELREGCPAPMTGWLYTPTAYAESVAELMGVASLLEDARAALSEARTQRDTEASNAEHEAIENASIILKLSEEVESLGRSHRPLLWVGIGAVGAALAGGLAVLAVWGSK